MDIYIPPSVEVLTEEMQDNLAASIPREEQGELIRNFIKVISEEMVTMLQWIESQRE